MALTVGTLVGYLDVDDTKFNSKVDQSGKRWTLLGGKFGAVMKNIGIAAVAGAAAATTAIVGVGTAGLKSFEKFNTGMHEVFTLLPGISGEAMGKMTQQTKDLAREMGVLPDEVVPALYQAISAGVPADNVFSFLETAQKAAVGGVTDLTTAVDGISSIINAYGSDVLSATEASDLMFTTVRLGKTTFEELSQSLFNVIPTASALGVEFGDVTAALAAMTAQGVPTSVATTQLRQLFVELSKAGSGVADTFTQITGQSFKDFVAGGGHVNEALDLLTQYAEDAGLGINDLFGSVEAGSAALSLTGKGAETFARNIDEMGRSAGATQAAYEEMEKGIGRSFDKLKANFETMMINIGEKLAPIVQSFADWLTRNMPTIESVVVGVFSAIATAISTVWDVLSGLKGMFQMIFTEDSGLKGFQAVFENFGQTGVSIATQLRDAWQEFSSFITDMCAAIAPIFTALWETITTIVGDIAEAIGAGWGEIDESTQGIWGNIRDFIVSALQLISDVVVTVLESIQKFWAEHGDAICAIVKAAVEFIRENFDTLMSVLSSLLNTGMAIMSGDWNTAWANIQAIAEAIWGQIESNLDTILIGGCRLVITAGQALITAAWDAIWKAVKDALSGWLGGIKTDISTELGKIPGSITSALAGVVEAVVAPFRSAYNQAKYYWNLIANLGKSRGSGVGPSDMPGYGVPIGRAWATGGVVPARAGGTWGLLAEAGEDEWIIPESKLKAMLTSASNVGLRNNGAGTGTGNVNNFNIDSITINGGAAEARQAASIFTGEVTTRLQALGVV